MTAKVEAAVQKSHHCLCDIENRECVLGAMPDIGGPGRMPEAQRKPRAGTGEGRGFGNESQGGPWWKEHLDRVQKGHEAVARGASSKAEHSLPPSLVGFCSTSSAGACRHCSLCWQAHPADSTLLPDLTALNAPSTQ